MRVATQVGGILELLVHVEVVQPEGEREKHVLPQNLRDAVEYLVEREKFRF